MSCIIPRARTRALVSIAFATASIACGPLEPAGGAPQYQELAMLSVHGTHVNLAGGNLLIQRTDLSIDTRLGTETIGATWNSATTAWLFSFDIRYDGRTFVDPSGAVYDTSELAFDAAIPGTIWVVVDAATIKSKGGRVFEFAADGGLAAVRWSSAEHPRLLMRSESIAAANRITAIDQCVSADVCSNVFSIAHDASGRVISIVDRADRRADFVWDAAGRLRSARDGLDTDNGWPGFRYEYDGSRLTALMNSEGERVEFGYDEAGKRVVRATRAGGQQPTYALTYFAPDGSLYRTRVVDPRGNSLEIEYDARRRVHSIENGAGERTHYEWLGVRPATRTDPAGVITQWLYRNDDVTRSALPSGNVLTFDYAADAVNRGDPSARPLLLRADDLGVLERRAYQPTGQLASISNGADERIEFDYAEDGTISSLTSPSGLVTTFSEYGEHGHPGRITRGERAVRLYYDAVGNLIEGPDFRFDSGPALGGVVSRRFDADRNVNLVELTDLVDGGVIDENEALVIEHRSDGRRTLILRPGGADTQFVYDVIGRLVERRERADGVWRSTRYERDPLGAVIALERPNGMQVERSYDAAGRVRTWTLLRDGGVEGSASFTHTAGRLTSITDSTRGAPELRSYDTAGRLAAVRYPDGEMLTLGYDARSRLSSAAFALSAGGPLLRSLAFAYDAADREVAIDDGGVRVIDRTFLDGRPVRTVYGNGLERSFHYDAETGRIAEMHMTTGEGMSVEATLVVPDDTSDGFCGLAHRCHTASTQTSGSLAAWSSETHVLGPRSSAAPPLTGAGKRVSVWWGSENTFAVLDYDMLSNVRYASPIGRFAYNAEGNRLLGAGAHVYHYDEAGYAISRDGVPLAWDAAGRIAAVGPATFEWDALGRPVRSAALGIERRWLFGGRVEADAYGTPTVLDLGEVRIDLVSGARRYRHYDFRGNVKLVSDSAGELIAHYHYEPYGLKVVFGSDEDRVRFARGRALGDLVLLGHRLYDPAAARFLAPDPVHQLINQYSYTLGNPVDFWDPTGAEGRVLGLTAEQLAARLGTAAAGTLLLSSAGGPTSVAAATPAIAAFGFAGAVLALIDSDGGFSFEGNIGPDLTRRAIGLGSGIAGVGGFGLGLFGMIGRGDDASSSPPGSPDYCPGCDLDATSLAPGPGQLTLPIGPGGGGGGGPFFGCAPVALASVPDASRLLGVLLVANALLGALALARWRRESKRTRVSEPGARGADG